MYVNVWKVYVRNWKTENQKKLSFRIGVTNRDKGNSKFNFYNLKTLYLKFHFNFGILRSNIQTFLSLGFLEMAVEYIWKLIPGSGFSFIDMTVLSKKIPQSTFFRKSNIF